MTQNDRVTHQLHMTAAALAARQRLHRAVAALAADPYDLRKGVALPVLQRQAREAARALDAEVDRSPLLYTPLSTGAAAEEGEAPPWPGLPHRPQSVRHRMPRPPLTGVQRLLARAVRRAGGHVQ